MIDISILYTKKVRHLKVISIIMKVVLKEIYIDTGQIKIYRTRQAMNRSILGH